MARDTSLETLFNEHSLEEIEVIRDNLASEIEKRTELLKSIVKEKYRDIVETSDANQSMKMKLKEVEQALWSLDKSISEFYTRVREPKLESINVIPTDSASHQNKSQVQLVEASDSRINSVVRRLTDWLAQMWEHFDAGNLRLCVKLLYDSLHLLEEHESLMLSSNPTVFKNFDITLKRAKEIIKNGLWHRINSAAPDQIGIIAGSDQEDLYKLSLNSSLEFLVEKMRKDLSDTSYHAQIRRYQPLSYFNSQTSEIDPTINDLSPPTSAGYVQIPKLISPELNAFLYKVCSVVNTIAGFNLNRCSIVDSLRITISHALQEIGRAHV